MKDDEDGSEEGEAGTVLTLRLDSPGFSLIALGRRGRDGEVARGVIRIVRDSVPTQGSATLG